MAGHLLVVEDDPTLGRAVERLLAVDGHRVVSARWFHEALAAPGAFDLGIFDIRLPDGCGIELADRLRAEGIVRDVVFYSGISDEARLGQARLRGTVVPKSRGALDLCNVVAKMIERR